MGSAKGGRQNCLHRQWQCGGMRAHGWRNDVIAETTHGDAAKGASTSQITDYRSQTWVYKRWGQYCSLCVTGRTRGMHGRVSRPKVIDINNARTFGQMLLRSASSFLSSRLKLVLLLDLGVHLGEERVELLHNSQLLQPSWYANGQTYLVLGLKLQSVDNRVVSLFETTKADESACSPEVSLGPRTPERDDSLGICQRVGPGWVSSCPQHRAILTKHQPGGRRRNGCTERWRSPPWKAAPTPRVGETAPCRQSESSSGQRRECYQP